MTSSLPRPREGAAPRIDRVARIVFVVACAWYGFTALWGMFGMPGGGHLGAGSISSIASAEQILRWKIPYPTWDWYGSTLPSKSSYECHHPYGAYYFPLPFLAIFGHQNFVVHLPGALFAAAVPFLLFAIARESWGTPAGAVAAVSYVVVPLAVGYSNFWGLEPIVILGMLLFFWGHSRHCKTRETRWLWVSLAGAGVTCAGDWIGYVMLAPFLGWAFARAFVLPARLTPPFPIVAYARWWALAVAIAIGTLLLWVGLFYKADQLGEWLSSGATRSHGNDLPLKMVLEARKDWIEFSFTPVAILVGKVAAPVCVARFLVLRRDEEAYAPTLLLGAVVQYVAFKQGADVHVFWPWYFAPYFALANAQLAHTLGGAWGWLAARYRPASPTAAGVTVLVAGLAAPLLMAPDAVRSLWIWRATGGRYDDHGTRIRTLTDVPAAFEKIIPHIPGTRVDVHPSVEWYWDAQWAFEGAANPSSAPVAGAPADSTHPFWVARASGLSSDEQRNIAHSAHVEVYGDVWVVDQREAPAPIDAYSMNEREPNPLEWLFLGGVELVRHAGSRPDPWLTWEWRTQLGFEAPAPGSAPATLDEMRIAHNVAVSKGDAAEARAWRGRIEAELDRGAAAAFEGVRLVGVRVRGGVEPRIESWFEAADAPPADGIFSVRSTVEARAPLSLIAPDAADREMAYAPSLPTRSWRPRFLYTTVTVMNHRIGRERYLGRWTGGWAPRLASGAAETSLAVVR